VTLVSWWAVGLGGGVADGQGLLLGREEGCRSRMGDAKDGSGSWRWSGINWSWSRCGINWSRSWS